MLRCWHSFCLWCCVLIRIFRKFPILHIQKEDFRFDRELMAEMYKSGLSMGLMSCLVGIGTILLQSAINTLGTTVIVAHTAARKVFELVSLPNSVLGSAMADLLRTELWCKTL